MSPTSASLLVMPKVFWNKFRLASCYITSLPFGSDCAPVIAHKALCLFFHEFFKGCPHSQVEFFHYVDNIIMLSVNPTLLCVLTEALYRFVEAKGPVISPKYRTELSGTVCLIGKKFCLK